MALRGASGFPQATIRSEHLFVLPRSLDKGEGFVKDKVVLSGVGDTAFRQSVVEDQDLQASR
jgi:hypothetical protein